MGKNRKFKNSYLVEIEGTTTNGAQAELFDTAIRAVCQAFGINSQQCSVKVKALSTDGDWDAEIRQLKEEK